MTSDAIKGVSSSPLLNQQFIEIYNTIDEHIRRFLGAAPGDRFTSLISAYYRRRPWMKGESDLHVFANLRNVIAHTTTDFSSPLFFASEGAVAKINEIAEHMLHPELMLPRFRRHVETVSTSDSVMDVLRLIRERDYSQFPVYNGNEFIGLLTENGITRWLARHSVDHSSTIAICNVSIRELLVLEESNAQCEFVSERTTLDEVVYCYAKNPCLEAILVTHNAKPSPDLLGITTRYDVIQLRSLTANHVSVSRLAGD